MRPFIKKPKVKHILWFLIFCIVFYIGYHVTYETCIIDRMSYPHLFSLTKSSTVDVVTTDEDGEEVTNTERLEYLLKEGDVFEQTFTFTSDYFLSVGTRIFLDEDNANEGSVKVELFDAETNELIADATYDTSELEDKQLLLASSPTGMVEGYQGKIMTYRLTVEEMGDSKITVSMGDTESNSGVSNVIINGESDSTLVLALRGADRQLTYWYHIFRIGAFLLFAVVAWTFWSLALTKIKLQNVFLPVGFVLAILFLLFLPPMSVPDEQDHMLEAYEKVNSFYGLNTDENDTAFIYNEDYHAMQSLKTTPTLLELDEIKEEITQSGREEGDTVVSHVYMHAKALAYLPGIIGIMIARAMGLNGFLVWYSGRFVAILFYLCMMYFAIKTAPAAKAAFFIIALFPMTIQQCCSYSYDGMIIEAVCVLTAVLLKWIYYKEEKIKKTEIAFLIYSCIILAVCKGGCYMPLVLLVLFIPSKRFANAKRAIAAKLAIIGTAGVSWLVCTLSYVFYVLAPTGTESTQLAHADAEAYTLGDLMSNFWLFIEPAFKSTVDSGSEWILSMTGTQLGWLNIEVTSWIPIIMLTMILFSMVPQKNKCDEAMVGMPEKVAIVILALLSVGMIYMSMFLDWTPKDAGYIWGIQARYFLPLLPPAMLLFRSRWMTIEKDVTKYFAFTAVSLYGMVFYDLLLETQKYLE
ncbi:MAG: DUF2142 domain-containing protein [Lachnospiraceae bacterium]|nr:DUF2142 domain-containing protein [Lachnospiraceae bacterium]